jgi:hypothetical protein
MKTEIFGKMENIGLRTFYKPYIDWVAKNENLTLSLFVNDCIRERLAKKTDFLADMEARIKTAEEMGIPGLVNTAIWEVETFMAPEKYEEYRKRFWEHHARIKKELENALSESPVFDIDSDVKVFPTIIE